MRILHELAATFTSSSCGCRNTGALFAHLGEETLQHSHLEGWNHSTASTKCCFWKEKAVVIREAISPLNMISLQYLGSAPDYCCSKKTSSGIGNFFSAIYLLWYLRQATRLSRSTSMLPKWNILSINCLFWATYQTYFLYAEHEENFGINYTTLPSPMHDPSLIPHAKRKAF